MRKFFAGLVLLTFASACVAAGHGGGGGGGGGARGGHGFGGGGFRGGGFGGGFGFGGYGRGANGFGIGFAYPWGGYYGWGPGYSYWPDYGYAACDPYYGNAGCGYAPVYPPAYDAPQYVGYAPTAGSQTVYPGTSDYSNRFVQVRGAVPAQQSSYAAPAVSGHAVTSVAYRAPASHTVYPGPAADGAETGAGRFLNDGRWHRFGER